MSEVALLSTAKSNSNSMVATLERVLVCSPQNAGWSDPQVLSHWKELGFLHAPNFQEAQNQHDALCRELQQAGAEVLCMPASESFSLDAVYAHDSSLPTSFGVVLMNPGKPNRCYETQEHSRIYEKLGIGVLGQIEAPGTCEAGDIVWLDAATLLVGRGYRTNAAAIEQLRSLFAPKGVDVIAAPLPYGLGPSACLHLMSLISLLDEHTAVVDLSWLAVETIKLLRYLGYGFIEIDPSERDSLACNVLSLGDKRLLALAENRKTNGRLREAGFDVRTFAGSELCINGNGGPTCLTRPFHRS